jgi:hypothetical protein
MPNAITMAKLKAAPKGSLPGRCVRMAVAVSPAEYDLIWAKARRRRQSLSEFLREAGLAAATLEPEIFPRHMPREVFDNDS